MSVMTCQGSMPFIVSTCVKDTKDPKTRKLIRRHVMLGKNSGKTRRYKPETLPASEGDTNPLGTPSQLDSLIKNLHDSGLRRTVSCLPQGHFAGIVGTRMLQDIFDCESMPLSSLYLILTR